MLIKSISDNVDAAEKAVNDAHDASNTDDAECMLLLKMHLMTAEALDAYTAAGLAEVEALAKYEAC